MGVGITGSNVYIYSPRVEPGRVLTLSHVSAEDQTSAFTKIRFGVVNTGAFDYLDELQNIDANELVVSASLLFLGAGDRLFVEFVGTSTDDILVVNARGWEKKI